MSTHRPSSPLHYAHRRGRYWCSLECGKEWNTRGEPVSGRCREHFVMSLAVAPSFDSLTSSPPHQYLLVIHLTFHAIGLWVPSAFLLLKVIWSQVMYDEEINDITKSILSALPIHPIYDGSLPWRDWWIGSFPLSGTYDTWEGEMAERIAHPH